MISFLNRLKLKKKKIIGFPAHENWIEMGILENFKKKFSDFMLNKILIIGKGSISYRHKSILKNLFKNLKNYSCWLKIFF